MRTRVSSKLEEFLFQLHSIERHLLAFVCVREQCRGTKLKETRRCEVRAERNWGNAQYLFYFKYRI